MPRRRTRSSGPALLLAALAFAGACESPGLVHPDTGAGANQPVPPTESCADLCGRLASCVVTLCNEDTASTQYGAAEARIRSECMTNCDETRLQSTFDAPTWSCAFQSSCRAVFEHDVCKAKTQYNCS